MVAIVPDVRLKWSIYQRKGQSLDLYIIIQNISSGREMSLDENDLRFDVG